MRGNGPQSHRGAEKRGGVRWGGVGWGNTGAEETVSDITMKRSDLSEEQFQKPRAKRAGSGQNYVFSLRSCLLKGLEFINFKLFNVSLYL